MTTLIIVTTVMNAAIIFLNHDDLCCDLNNFMTKSCISNFIKKIFEKSTSIMRSIRQLRDKYTALFSSLRIIMIFVSTLIK